ncbi:MAG: FAD-dependent thymidylate synthase [Alphaproteobacteria bacterium]|jgi:thymidylate synthase (FAD)|nr:FAD-dependent thymidylate synthase [Alphaproteobacteria bacterium]
MLKNLKNLMTNTTNRTTNDSLEKYLQQSIPCLNKGFVRLVDYMGSDSSITQAARVSYGAGTKTINDDTALIRYLLRHKHTTPFEMCEIKLHIKAPIFIARQWLRHRTANVNEYSARYSIMEHDYYVPEEEQLCYQSKSNKQGRSEIIPQPLNAEIREKITDITEKSFATYDSFINEDINLAKEIARGVLPVNVYTQFYWKIDLHNLLHFLRLRADSHAQYEIRVYAEAILELVKLWTPITYQAFMDYAVNAETFSSEEISLLKKLLKGEKVNPDDYRISKRELANLKQVFDLDNL